ncbi:ankyrin repeat domain-containing protein [Isosphaeraceae bacterium EP7]
MANQKPSNSFFPPDGPIELHTAAGSGNLEEVIKLLGEGCDINAFDFVGRTPLHHAAAAAHLEVVAYLIAHGADANAQHVASIGNTPLGEIAGGCSLAMVKMLVAAGADPTRRGWMQLNALDKAKSRKRNEGPSIYRFLRSVVKR